MKKILLSAFFFALVIGSTTAQNNKRFEEAASYAADYLCKCVNKVYSGVDEDIRQIIIQLNYMSESEFEAYVASLPEAQQIRLATQAMLMADEQKSIEFDACNNNMVKELDRKYTDDFESMGYTENDMINLILARLKKRNGCQFSYYLLKMGLAIDDSNYEDPFDNSNGSDNPNHGGGGTGGGGNRKG